MKRRSHRVFRTVSLGLVAAVALLLAAACSSSVEYTASDDVELAFVGPDVIPLPTGFFPEGVVAGDGPELFTGSLANGSVVRVDVRTGSVDEVVPPQDGRIAVGLAHDPRSDLLWVAGGFDGMGHVYDATTGESVVSFGFGGGFANDVIVTRTTAWFTDSFAPLLYAVELDGTGQPTGAVSTVPLGGDFEFLPGEFNANGIEATPDGARLLVVNSTVGTLYAVHPDTGDATEVDLGGANLVSGDGLLLHGPFLYVVQNALNQIAAVRLSPDLESGEVVAVLTSPDFDVPTTVAGFGSSLYAVNARFGIPDPFTAEYDVVRIDQATGMP